MVPVSIWNGVMLLLSVKGLERMGHLGGWIRTHEVTQNSARPVLHRSAFCYAQVTVRRQCVGSVSLWLCSTRVPTKVVRNNNRSDEISVAGDHF